MNEVFNTAQSTKSEFIETYSKYLKDWIEAIAFYSDDLTDFDLVNTILENFKQKYYFTTSYIETLMYVFKTKFEILECYNKRKAS